MMVCLIVAAIATLPAAGMAASGALSKKAAAAAARGAVGKVGRKTGAKSTTLVGCRRTSTQSYFCQAQNNFRTGARRCVGDVVVKSSGSGVRARITQYLCY